MGFAPVGVEPEPMHALAPLSEPHEWIASTTLWQSGFLPHAASGFAHVLSTHLPQSLSPNAGAGGGDAAADAPDEPGAELSGDMSPPPAALLAGALESDGAAELESLALLPLPSLFSELLSSAGVSGGLPPPQASHARGIAARRTRDPRDKLVWLRMTAVNTCSRAEITEGNEVLRL